MNGNDDPICQWYTYFYMYIEQLNGNWIVYITTICMFITMLLRQNKANTIRNVLFEWVKDLRNITTPDSSKSPQRVVALNIGKIIVASVLQIAEDWPFPTK